MSTGEHVAEGTRLGPYRLHGRLGEGGMGVVHLGIDGGGRAVAVKVLRSHIAHDPDARARLAREVSTLRRVRHPLVAEVVDADVEGDQPYVVTRYVPGSGLDVVVRDGGPLAPVDLLRVGRGLSDALGAIHAVHVVHRDLKPANVLMLDGDPVVIDFGIAHVADDVRLTSTGLVMGTPGYLSPEVIDGGRVTQATDWWGWAATLAYAASGRPPFGRGPMDVVIDRVRRGQTDLEGVDARLRPLLHAALSVDARLRPTSPEVLDALDRYAAGGEATVTISVPGPTRPLPDGAVPRSTQPQLPTPPPRPVASPVATAAPLPAGPVALPGGAAGVEPWVGRPSLADELIGPAPVPGAAVAGDDAPVPPGGRGVVVAGLLLAIVAAALVAPIATAAGVAVLGVLARTVERNRFALTRRRMVRGPRRSDVLVATLCSPWHLVRSVLVTALAALQPVLLGLATAFCVGLLLPSPDGTAHPGSLVAVGAAAAMALLAAWWGLAGGSLRRGTAIVLRVGVPERARWWWALVLVLVAAVLGWWAYTRGEPLWWPLATDPADLLHR